MDTFLQTVGALNDGMRIKILRFIYDDGTGVCCDIERAFGMIQSCISQHLKTLKDASVLRVERIGYWAYYGVRSPLDRFRQNALEEIRYLEINNPRLTLGFTTSKEEITS